MRNIIQMLLIGILVINAANNQAQCVYNASAINNGNVYNDTAVVCAGSGLSLFVEQTNCPKISGNFNNGILDTTLFEQNNSILFTNPCITTNLPASGLVAWIGATTFPREIKTKNLNLVNKNYIEWDMKYGDIQLAPDCEPPDGPSEGVYLEYSVDNGINWVQFPGIDQYPSGMYGNGNYINGSGGYWMPVSGNFATGPYYKWNHYVSTIPSIARTSHTMVRWFQPVFSSSTSDHWGIDNIEILNCPLVTVLWSNGTQQMNPPPVYPASDTFYSVIVYDSSQSPVLIFKDTVFIVISNSIPSSSFSVVPHICSMDTALILYTGNASLSSGFHWNFGDFSYVLSGSGAGPYKVVWGNPWQDSVIQSIKLIVDLQTACASPLTTQPITIYGNTELVFILQSSINYGCSPLNINFINESISPPNLQTNFTWYFGDDTISDSISPSHTYINPGFYDITLESHNNKGCSAKWSGVDIIKVLELPATPVITKLEDTLYTVNDLNYNYQWYMNDSLILFATNYYFVPQQIAYYTVTVQNYEGCISNPSNRVFPFDESGLLVKDALIPNPTNLFFSIKFNPKVNQIDILNVNGVLVKTYPKADPFNFYYIDELSNGLYFVKIYVDGFISMQKLIKY